MGANPPLEKRYKLFRTYSKNNQQKEPDQKQRKKMREEEVDSEREGQTQRSSPGIGEPLPKAARLYGLQKRNRAAGTTKGGLTRERKFSRRGQNGEKKKDTNSARRYARVEEKPEPKSTSSDTINGKVI